MNRSFFALGAATAALALTAGPAWAAPTATQSVNDSILAAQVGSVQVNAPVRVLSDGDNAAPGAAATGGRQTTDDSVGTAQVTAVRANVPVRVLSDGENGSAATRHPTGGQTVRDSIGSAQAGSVEVDAPVRVLSEADDRAPGGSGSPSAGIDAPASSNAGPDAPQWADGSVGVLQVGFLDIGTPIRVPSDHEITPAATASADPGPAETGSDPSPGKGAGGAADDANGRGAPDTGVVAPSGWALTAPPRRCPPRSSELWTPTWRAGCRWPGWS